MSNLKKYALQSVSILHLVDGNGDPMYADGPDGNVDKSRPMRAHLYGPGTRQFAAARVAQSNRNMDRIKKKGKTEQTVEESTNETATFLASCTARLENIEDGDLAGRDLAMAIYSDLELCFIPTQIDRYIGETANFTGVPPTA